MTDDDIRERVRARLVDGTLPRQIHIGRGPLRPGERPPDGMMVGTYLPDPCAACDDRGTEIRYYPPGQTAVAFHVRCHEIWDEERVKPTPRADEGLVS